AAAVGMHRRHVARASCARVLTVKKTVIRFRHNNTWQQRVSANPTTLRDTTQSSARMPGMVDSVVVSPGKLEAVGCMEPAAHSAAGFSCRGQDPERRAQRVVG